MTSVAISPFRPRDLNNQAMEQLLDLFTLHHRELHPNDPPLSRELRRDYLLNPHPLWEIFRWCAVDTKTGQIVGMANLAGENEKSPQYDLKRETADIFVVVHPEYRRRGVGSQLFDTLVEEARRHSKNRLQGDFSLAAARDFLLKRGAIITSERKLRRLYLANVDWDAVEQWQRDGAVKNAGAKLLTLHVIPDDLMDRFVRLYNETALEAPDHSSGESVAMELTSATDRRETERLLQGKGIIWTTLIAQEPDGRLSGFTEVFRRTAEPFVLIQGQTGVLRSYRGQGRGKWLKAEMVHYVRKNFADAGCLETGNANVNAPMLSINNRLGYRDYLDQALFAIKLE